MKFSILVPVYNVEEYLEQCIESILNQTYKNFELILVDDGSNDNSGKICDAYAKTYPNKVKVIHKKNEGVLAARIDGIQVAKGNFCVFVDADDYVENNLLERVCKYIVKEELDMLIFSFQYYRNSMVEERKYLTIQNFQMWTIENKRDIYTRLICSGEITSLCTKVIKTEILKLDSTDYTMFYGKNMGEDLLQSLYPITAADRIMFIDEPLYDYRINDKSVSRSFRISTIPGKNTIHVYEKILEYIKLWDMDDEEIRARLNARWFNDTMYMMSKYYENAETIEDKEKIIRYNWDSMLPIDAYDKSNIFENEAYKKLYQWIKVEDIASIHKYFKGKRRTDKYKKMKREIKKWLKIWK